MVSKYKYPLLSDPKHDRVIKDVIPPPHKPLPTSDLFPEGISSCSNFRQTYELDATQGPFRQRRHIECGRLPYDSEESFGYFEEGAKYIGVE
jgi:hypothetical protein